MKVKNLSVYIVPMAVFALCAIVFNYAFLENLIIPDPCVYHNNGYETTALFDLFYCFPPAEGGHPAPTLLNFLATLIIGGSIGFLTGWIINKVRESRKAQ